MLGSGANLRSNEPVLGSSPNWNVPTEIVRRGELRVYKIQAYPRV